MRILVRELSVQQKEYAPKCDICCKSGERQKDTELKVTWDRSFPGPQLSEVSCYTESNSYGFPTRGSSYEVCPECFFQKLAPWLESQKIKPTV